MYDFICYGVMYIRFFFYLRFHMQVQSEPLPILPPNAALAFDSYVDTSYPQ